MTPEQQILAGALPFGVVADLAAPFFLVLLAVTAVWWERRLRNLEDVDALIPQNADVADATREIDEQMLAALNERKAS